jgi:hypothetical protein
MVRAGGQEAVKAALDVIDRFSKNTFPPALASLPGSELYRAAWDLNNQAAEKYNAPGLFTAFIGYEWTSNTGGNNLHRVVIYRDGADKAGQTEPFTTNKPAGSDNPRDLWKWMDAYQKKTGGQVLAIAHNGNLSNGIMFPMIESFTGKPVDREYATERHRWEPLYEVTQIKGDGETHPFLSPNDEFKVDEARLFVEAPIVENVYFFGEVNLATREQPDIQARLGELYLDIENISQLWHNDHLLNARVGRLYTPYGEEYLTRYAIDNPFISHSLSDLWGVDEGIELYGRAGKMSYCVIDADHEIERDNRRRQLVNIGDFVGKVSHRYAVHVAQLREVLRHGRLPGREDARQLGDGELALFTYPLLQPQRSRLKPSCELGQTNSEGLPDNIGLA